MIYFEVKWPDFLGKCGCPKCFGEKYRSEDQVKDEPMISTLLPLTARQTLVDASKTPIDGDPLARQKAIEDAIKQTRFVYSNYFRPEWIDESE